MRTMFNPDEEHLDIENKLTWDVIDEAKSHFKSALARMDADRDRARLEGRHVPK